jgi:uncharacterized lipoprotein YddW (UPF0748 family)
MLNKLFILILVLSTLSNTQELRGTWLARNSLVSKDALAQAMDTIAANNFNVVYINVWSRGYPLWQSDVFFNHTGVRIDPSFQDRDILAEAVAEAHKHGIHVEAWFEYGFVGGYTTTVSSYKGPIFQAHPDWLAKKINGNDIDTISGGSGFFYWMIHTKPETQNFLIELATEICRKYDVDGIELDRIRYAGLQWGYDSYTDSLWRSEHNNSPIPSNISDTSWIRWRANKLNLFMARAYDSIKSVNQNVNVSNAPSMYSSSGYSSYTSFCQDWIWWVNNNKVDNVQVQSYVNSTNTFSSILDYISTLVTNKSKIYPSFATNPNGVPIGIETTPAYVTITRSKGYKGNSIWYYSDLLGNYFSKLKSTVYNQKVDVPHSSSDWRDYFSIDKISDTINTKQIGNWLQSTLIGFDGVSKYVEYGSQSSIEYYFNVPASGTYEVYVYNVVAVNRTDSAKYFVYDSLGNVYTKYINQNSSINRRWSKLGDYSLSQGRRLVSKLTSENLKPGQYLSADALMIVLNRRLSPSSITSIDEYKHDVKKKEFGFNLISYPNPFNSQSNIFYKIIEPYPYIIKIYNTMGEEVFHHSFYDVKIGDNELRIYSNNFTSGVYFLTISQLNKMETIKLILTK